MFCNSPRRVHKTDKVYLTEDELVTILAQAIIKARKVKSGVRNENGNETSPKIHVAIQGKGKKNSVVVHSDEDAWESGKELAKGKATTALHHSSNENAMTSHSVGHLVSSGKIPSSQGVHFAGGVPLYKTHKDKSVLVGSIGVAGDLPEVDEAIAVAASKGFEAPTVIRSDSVLEVPFYTGSPVEELKVIEVLPTIPESSPLPPSPSGRLPPLPSSASLAGLPSPPRLSPSPRGSLPPSPARSPMRSLPPSPARSPMRSLPPSPARSPMRSLPPSPSRGTLPPSPSSRGLPVIQRSPLPVRKASTPALSQLTPLK